MANDQQSGNSTRTGLEHIKEQEPAWRSKRCTIGVLDSRSSDMISLLEQWSASEANIMES